jgi:opacity protein-like surface antigen
MKNFGRKESSMHFAQCLLYSIEERTHFSRPITYSMHLSPRPLPRTLATLLSLAAILLSAAPTGVRAQFFEQERFYFRFDAGGNLTETTDLEKFYGPVAPGSEVEFNPGLRLGFGGGYRLTEWLAGEVDLGLIQNTIDSMTDAEEADAFLGQFPVMVNLRLQLPNRSIFTPYAGIGAGFSTLMLDADPIIANNVYVHGTDWDLVFAYQGFAGVRCALNENMGLAIEYRYVGSEGPDFNSDWDYGFDGDNGVSFGRLRSHCFSLAFELRF